MVSINTFSRVCNAPAVAPPSSRWPPPWRHDPTSRPAPLTSPPQRHPDVTREKRPVSTCRPGTTCRTDRERLATPTWTDRPRHPEMTREDELPGSSRAESSPHYINHLYACPLSLSYTAALSLAVPPWDWHIQYKLLFQATSSRHCLRKEPHLTSIRNLNISFFQ
jgi:hypothetical protein